MKNLGIIFDKQLKFHEHKNSIGKKSYSMLGFVMGTASELNNLPGVAQFSCQI